jgi:vitamin B12 transporter
MISSLRKREDESLICPAVSQETGSSTFKSLVERFEGERLMITTLFLFFLFDVRGIISDPSGRPVEGAQIACGSETKASDAHGAFELSRACEATITKPGFADKRVTLADSGDNPVKLELAAASDRVVVTATRAPVALENAGVAADVFTAKDFEPAHGTFVQNLLRDVPGIDVVQTGQNGALTSLFARGGNSNAALVLLDGVPVTEPGGSLDFVHLASAGLDRMEVVRGPESVLFGAEGSSAVIQMFTRRGDPEAKVPHGSLMYERGSFSTDHWTGALNGGLASRADYSFTADQFRSTGEFPNDAYRITSGTANVGYHFSEKTQLRAVYREFDSYTGDPGPTASGPLDFLSNSFDRDSTLSVHLDDARGTNFTQRVQFGYHRYRDRFNDGFDPPFLSETHRDVAGYQGTFTHRGGALVFGYDYQHQAGIISAADRGRDNNGLFVHEQYALTPRIFVTAGARVEHSTTFGTEFAPRGAVTFRLPQEVYFRVSGSRGVQEPSLLQNFARESYGVGNPNLKPETTTSFEAGLFREWFSRRVRTEVSWFRNSFHDLILFDFFANPATWENVQQSWARGVELSGTVRLAGLISLRTGYTRLYTRNLQTAQPLLRRPLNAGTISLELAPRRWTIAAGGRFVGQRPDSNFFDPGVSSVAGYNYVFVNGSWQATRHVEPFLRFDNALNERYQEVLGYAALRRIAAGGVKLTW